MFMLLVSLLSFSEMSFASSHSLPVFGDPRNQPGYALFFDVGATSKADIANGYGGYLQYYYSPEAKEVFRYCDNFEGEGLNGRPNLQKKRMIHVPFGTVNPTAYLCHDISLAELQAGRKIIYIGEKSFFALKSAVWEKNIGGILLFQFAKKVPLIGSPKIKNVELRVNRQGSQWTVQMAVPKGELLDAKWLQFIATVSGLGIPNGISDFTLNPGTQLERRFDIDTLEDAQ